MNPSQSTAVGALTSDHVNLKNGSTHHHDGYRPQDLSTHKCSNHHMMVIILKIYDNLEVPPGEGRSKRLQKMFGVKLLVWGKPNAHWTVPGFYLI